MKSRRAIVILILGLLVLPLIIYSSIVYTEDSSHVQIDQAVSPYPKCLWVLKRTPIERVKMFIIVGIINSPFNGETPHYMDGIYFSWSSGPQKAFIQELRILENAIPRNGSSIALIREADVTIYEVTCLRPSWPPTISFYIPVVTKVYPNGVIRQYERPGDLVDNTCISVVTKDPTSSRVIGNQTTCAIYEARETVFETAGQYSISVFNSIADTELPLNTSIKGEIISIAMNGEFKTKPSQSATQGVNYTFYRDIDVGHYIDFKGPYSNDYFNPSFPMIWAFSTSCPRCYHDPLEYHGKWLYTVILTPSGDVVKEALQCIEGCNIKPSSV